VAAFDQSTAVGFGATTTRANQVKLGGAGSSVTIGDLAASTAAQSGATSLVTTDASGTLGVGIPVASLASSAALSDLAARTDRGIRKANEGVAMALAMETPNLPAGTNYGVAGGIGYYQKRAAGTAAIAARVGENAAISAGVGVGFDSGEVGARGGFQFAW
jgi:hypothetical protein